VNKSANTEGNKTLTTSQTKSPVATASDLGAEVREGRGGPPRRGADRSTTGWSPEHAY